MAWQAVVDGVQEARAGYRLEQLPLGRMSGPRVLGVLHDAVLFLLEQLQGAAQCYNHRFRFHQQEKLEEELPINPSGCARGEVYTRYKPVREFIQSISGTITKCGALEQSPQLLCKNEFLTCHALVLEASCFRAIHASARNS